MTDETLLPPEIIAIIASLLSQSDLAQCTVVSKAWHICFIPILWRHLGVHRPKTFNHFQQLLPSSSTTPSLNYAQYIRSLSIHYSNWTTHILGLLIDSASDLTSLELHQPHLFYPASSITVAYGSRLSRHDKGTRATEKDDMDLQALDVLLKRLLAKNKSLSTLRLIGIDTQTLVSNEAPSRAQPLFRAICDFKSQLTVIDIQDQSQHISNLSPRLLRQLLSSISDTVEELSISLSVSDHVDESTLYPGRTVEENRENEQLLSNSGNSTTYPLRKLLIRGAMKGFGRYIWNDYLKGCRRIRSLTLGWTRDDPTDNSRWILSCLSNFVNLEELDLASWTTLEDHEIAAFLQIPHGLLSTRGTLVTSSGSSLSINRTTTIGTGLRVLRVPGTDRFGARSIQSLLQPHITRHIEKLSLVGCGANIRSRILTELLRSCPKLASLETMCRWESPRTRSVRLYAKWMDLSSRPWTCTNLTVLKLMIVGVRGSTLAPSSSSGASLQVASQRGETESGLTSGLLGTGYSQTFTRTMSLQGDQRLLQEELAAELERRVCAQLGALVHLQELSLGLQFRETFGSWDYNTNQPQFDLDQVRMGDEELDEPDNEPNSFEGSHAPDFYSQYVDEVENLHDFELDYFERGNKTFDEDAIDHEGDYSDESDDEYDDEDNDWNEEPPPPSPGFQSSSECLHLSLPRGGLQLLSDLKQLRILNVQSMGHRIRLPELMWMVSNWPRLRILEGVFASQDPNPDLDKVNNGPIQPQRPSGHVEGTSDSDSDSNHSHRASLPSWDSRSNSRTERFYWSAERQKMAEEFLRETSPNLVLKQ